MKQQKQISLLDSFVRRQLTPKEPKKQNMVNSQNQQLISKITESKQVGEVYNKKIKINKMTIDSDQEEKFKNLTLSDKKQKDIEKYQDIDMIDQYKEQPAKKIRGSIKKNITQISKDSEGMTFTDKTPQWATLEHCKDKNLLPPDHPNYDPSTLHVPQQAWDKFTGPMKQYWKIKSQNFDKVIFFKLGKFYQLFYQDAAVGNKYLNLNWMGTKMHTGFPQKCLDRYLNQLVHKLGFKVVVVQQMETPQQMEARLKLDKQMGRKSQKTLNRDVTQVLTKGTILTPDVEQIFMPNYLISVRSNNSIYSYALLEVNTNAIIIGIADSFQKLKTMLFQTRPVELLYDPDNLSFHDVEMMRQSFLQMVISKFQNKNNIWHPLNSINELERLKNENILVLPKIFTIINSWDKQIQNLVYSSLSGMFLYLKNILKFDYVIGAVKFTFYQKQTLLNNMALDSQALQHLQIFETASGEFGSLFKIMDRTKTKFGRRLFRRWIMSPLYNINMINDRLNAVQDLQNIILQRNQVSDFLKKLPDIEKTVNRLYHYAIKSLANKAIYFQDVSTARFKQFRQLINNFEIGWNAIKILRKNSKLFKSQKLKKLININNNIDKQSNQNIYFDDQNGQEIIQGLLPNVMEHLNQFRSYIKWENDIPIPQKGLVQEFDRLQDQQDNVKNQLEQYLQSVKMIIKQPCIKYTHTKERYELQIPQKSEKRRPNDFIFTSKRAGFSRYVSKQSRALVKKLDKVDEQLKSQMAIFVGFFFDEFKKKQNIWEKFIKILAEIDCLISLSIYSFQGNHSRPNFSQNCFEIIGAVHPCLTYLDFIPNDIIMKQKTMLLTGPNMGGKSTMLRTVCLLTIMAQMGCYIPAKYYNVELIDRIFTRIGASDQLQQGKSTFFIQMEQTKNVLEFGTSKSLAIMDQLGRGTSTFDGMAIAYSVLKDITEKIQCYCLFATHYHTLSQQFTNSNEVSLKKMDCIVQGDKIVFLYKLVQGSACQSFGINVAKVVARQKSQQMKLEIDNKVNLAFIQIEKFLNQN